MFFNVIGFRDIINGYYFENYKNKDFVLGIHVRRNIQNLISTFDLFLDLKCLFVQNKITDRRIIKQAYTVFYLTFLFVLMYWCDKQQCL